MGNIKIPRKIWEAWEEALLSGLYKKGTNVLYDPLQQTYCCLGVLQKVVSGSCERIEPDVYNSVPSISWLEAHGITFIGSVGCLSAAPVIESEGVYITHINDLVDDNNEQIYTFKDIAAMLKTEVEFV